MHTYNLSETSLILHWFTVEQGLIKTVLKGGRDARGRGGRGMRAEELYAEYEIMVAAARGGGDLHSLRECEVRRSLRALRTSYDKLLMASYFGSLLESWVVPGQPEPEVYDLFVRALDYIERKEVTWKGVTHFEKELCRLLGYAPIPVEVQKLYRNSAKLEKLRASLRGRLSEEDGSAL